MQRFAVLCCVVTLLGAASLFAAPSRAARAATHTVAIDGVTFVPATLVVKAGETVVWVNKDPFPHTVASQTGGFNSPAIAPGQTWSYTPPKPGVFPYLCTLHPTMHATLTVE
jgi:plastocyanin